MDILKIIAISIIFLLGFLSANLINFYFVYGIENPFAIGLSGLGSTEAPGDFIQESQIRVYDDGIMIDIKGASIGRYAPTGSMKPLLDKGANGIRIEPQSEDNVNIGDIITYQDGDSLIIHRVIDKGMDGNGTYFIAKGDNNEFPDGKVRFEDIKYITVGILW